VQQRFKHSPNWRAWGVDTKRYKDVQKLHQHIMLLLLACTDCRNGYLLRLMVITVGGGTRSFFVSWTFQSHHDNNQPLLHAPTNQMETKSIILALVCEVKEPIEWLN
jgi:hypothetical protein